MGDRLVRRARVRKKKFRTRTSNGKNILDHVREDEQIGFRGGLALYPTVLPKYCPDRGKKGGVLREKSYVSSHHWAANRKRGPKSVLHRDCLKKGRRGHQRI